MHRGITEKDLSLSEKMLEGMRVLVMEDEYLIAMDVEQLCRDHGAEEVVILRTLEELGDDPFDTFSFDAAIVDLRLGGETTLEFAQQLAERKTPFVFATGYSSAKILLEAFPDVPVVDKPYAGEVLMDAMRTAVQRARGSCRA
jgi:DNA-binding response OmpR family regulator